jgi:CheY-like chemotaxis protein
MSQFQQILLIDDDTITNFLNKKLLEKHLLTEDIVVALNGEEALHHLKNSKKSPELIFLDINMPVMNGFEFLETYEKLTFPDQKESKIFVLTTSNHHIDLLKIKHYKVAGYINKPLTLEKLKAVDNDNFIN